mgnify:CR=1 FL=1
MIPFVMHSLGDKSYGLWIFIASFFDLSKIFDLGFSPSVQRYLSRAIGTEDHNEANIVVNTSLFMLSVIGTIALVFVMGAAFLVPLFVKDITVAALFNWITLFANSLAYLASFIAAKKVASYLIFSGRFIIFSRIKALFQYGAHTFINKIADNLRFGIDNFVITIFLELSSVTLFSIASRLITGFMDFISNGINVLMPVFSQYESNGDYQSIREKFILTSKISGYAAVLIGGILLIFGKMFIIRWMGPEYKAAYHLLAVLVIPITLALMQCPSVEALYGVSKQKFYTISNVIEGLANLVLSIILVKKYGLMGVALGTAIPMFVIKLFVQPVYTCRVIKLSLSYYYIHLMGMSMVKSTIILGILWLAVRSFIMPNYLHLALQITLCLILFTLVIFFAGLKSTERQYVKRILIPNL